MRIIIIARRRQGEDTPRPHTHAVPPCGLAPEQPLDDEGKISCEKLVQWIYQDKVNEVAKDSSTSEYEDLDWSMFEEVLRSGNMAVVKASYFKMCLENGESFKDRSNIPEDFIYDGEGSVSKKRTGGPLGPEFPVKA